MWGIAILVLLIGLGLCYYGWSLTQKEREKDLELEKENLAIKNENDQLILNKERLLERIRELNQQTADEERKLSNMSEMTSNMNERAAAAFEQYVDALESSYDQKELEFQNSCELLDTSYNTLQMHYIEKLDNIRNDLDKISATRAAAIEAQRQEKIIEENIELYSLEISAPERNDIQTLERVKKDLNNPRILSMLIWQTFFKDKMNNLCNNILGIKTRCGIYKITNQLTKECYIGQSVDVAKRWKDHAKCGLDIDRPQGNKLYQAMMDYGLWNFTFELLEECKGTELNEKEKYFIELYQSDKFGYNKTGGNK